VTDQNVRDTTLSPRVDVPHPIDGPPGGAEATAPEPRGAGARLGGAVRELLITLGLALVLYLVIQTFVAQTFQVQQHSMEPSLDPDQYLLVDKLTPRFDDYSRGDVVVFHPSDGKGPAETPFIKRVIGVAGDHVELVDGAVLVNGAELDEPYLNPDGDTRPICGRSEWTVGPGELFLLGDHRSASRDSRCESVGLVPVSEVVGRAWLRFWPIQELTLLQTPTYAGAPAAAP